jgi:hypothetical protein
MVISNGRKKGDFALVMEAVSTYETLVNFYEIT